jgi:septum formation protein
LLKAAGVTFEVVTPQVDEAIVREAVKTGAGGVEPADVAEILARAKAEEVSARHPDAVVIGADQILSCDDEIFSKAETIDDARATLLKLRGRTAKPRGRWSTPRI